MREYTPQTLADEYRKRHCGSIASLLELAEENPMHIEVTLCIDADGSNAFRLRVKEPYFFFLNLFRYAGDIDARLPFSMPAVEESCRDILFLLHHNSWSLH